MARTFGTLISEARTLLQDVVQMDGTLRYSDQEMYDAINGALAEARVKRPDLFLDMGLRTPTPTYGTNDTDTPWPFDNQLYNPVLYYTVGRTELRDDTFSDNSRAVTLMNKFVSQLLQTSS
jgi:hypothetical protein